MARFLMTGRLSLAALALTAVAACGRSEAPTTTTSSETSGELAPVNVADRTAYAEWLKANEIARTEVDFGSGTRAAAGSDAAAWALLPRGEVRTEGLRTWRLEVDREAFEKGGYLEFRQGKKVLYKDATPFDPGSSRFCEGAVPAAVVKALKAGETVTWGLFYPDAKELNAVATFKVVNKPQVAKQVEKLELNRLNARQSPEIKALARNQVLVNNSLFSEALLGSMNLASTGKMTDPHVGEAFYKIVECMRRLDLEEAPLYEAAKSLATAKGPNMASPNGNAFGGGAAGGGRSGLSFDWVQGDRKELQADPNGDPTPAVKEMAKDTEQNDGSGSGTASGPTEQGGTADGPTATPDPTDPVTPVDPGAETPTPPSHETPDGPTSELEHLYNMAKEEAKAAEDARDAANQKMADAMARAQKAQEKVAEYTEKSHDMTATPAERDAAAAEMAKWSRALQEAQKQAVEARQEIEAAEQARVTAEAQIKALGAELAAKNPPMSPEAAALAGEVAAVEAQFEKAKDHAQKLMSDALKAQNKANVTGSPEDQARANLLMAEAEAAQRVAAEKNRQARALREQLEVLNRTK